MVSATNQDTYGNPAWGPGTGYRGSGPRNHESMNGPWGPPPGWAAPAWQLPWLPRPVGIAAMVLGFIVFWPIGLAILAYLWGTGRMGCKNRWRRNGYQPEGGGNWKTWAFGAGNGMPWGGNAAPASGNHAFDEYRSETLRRLEEEQQEFGAFLERLRFARDKAEFDQFMTERRARPTPPTHPGGEQPAT